MENNFKNFIKGLKKVGKVTVPAFAVLAVLGCASTKDLPINNTLLNQKAKPQVTTLNNEDASYKDAKQYTLDAEDDVFQAVFMENKIYDESKYDYNREKDVYTEYSNLAIKKAEANNQLANAYNGLRNCYVEDTKKQFNITTQDIIKIAEEQDNHKNIPNNLMVQVSKIAYDNIFGLNLKNISMAALGADKAEYKNIDKFDDYNENIYTETNQSIDFIKRQDYDPRKFMKDVLAFNEFVTLQAFKYSRDLKGEDSTTDINILTSYFDSIKTLAKINKLTDTQRRELLDTMKKAAQLMATAGDILGGINYVDQLKFCHAQVYNMASTYRLIDTLDYMAELGYDVKNINIGTYAQNTINNTQEKDSIKDENTDLKVKPFFYGGVGGDFTGQHGGVNVAVGGNLPLNKTWALDGQIKGNFKFGWKDDTHDLATFSLEPGAEVTFGNHNLGANAIFGLTFMWDPSFTIGGKLKYAYKFNDYITAGVATEVTYNTKHEVSTLIGVSAKFSFGNSPFKLITNLNGGWTFVNESTREIRPGAETPKGEQLSDEPIYGTDDITSAGPTVHKGKSPVKSVDLTKY